MHQRIICCTQSKFPSDSKLRAVLTTSQDMPHLSGLFHLQPERRHLSARLYRARIFQYARTKWHYLDSRQYARSAQPTRTGGRQIFEKLRSKGIGGFQPSGGFGHREIKSFGNLETIPPYTFKSGEKHPAGRIIMGKHFSELPAESMLMFRNRQVLQVPLILETG